MNPNYSVKMKFRGFDKPIKTFEDESAITFWERYPKIPGLVEGNVYWIDCISLYNSKDIHEPSKDGELPTGIVYPYGDTDTDGFIVDLIYFDIIEPIDYSSTSNVEDCYEDV